MKEILAELQQFLANEQPDLDELSAALSVQHDKISDLEHKIDALKNDVQSNIQSSLS